MITLKQVEERIRSIEQRREINSATTERLNELYSLRELMQGKGATPKEYSTKPEPVKSGSEFINLAQTKNSSEVLSVVDDVMEFIKMFRPNLYKEIIMRISKL